MGRRLHRRLGQEPQLRDPEIHTRAIESLGVEVWIGKLRAMGVGSQGLQRPNLGPFPQKKVWAKTLNINFTIPPEL